MEKTSGVSCRDVAVRLSEDRMMNKKDSMKICVLLMLSRHLHDLCSDVLELPQLWIQTRLHDCHVGMCREFPRLSHRRAVGSNRAPSFGLQIWGAWKCGGGSAQSKRRGTYSSRGLHHRR